MSDIHDLSYATVPLRTVKNDVLLSHGTGFFFQSQAKDIYLVTNFHVASNRRPDNKQPLGDPSHADPTHIEIGFHDRSNPLTPASWKRIELSAAGKTAWLEHKSRCVDVVALKLDSITANHYLKCFNNDLITFDMKVTSACEVSIIGYPFGMSDEKHNLPIWKTGHIASEPEIDFGDHPGFLVDASTFPGMSGSPVVAIKSEMYQRRDGGFTGGTTALKFMGVFSGEHIMGNQKLDLGIVWRGDIINEIISAT